MNINAPEGDQDPFVTLELRLPIFKVEKRLWARVVEAGIEDELIRAYSSALTPELILSLGGMLQVLSTMQAAGVEADSENDLWAESGELPRLIQVDPEPPLAD